MLAAAAEPLAFPSPAHWGKQIARWNPHPVSRNLALAPPAQVLTTAPPARLVTTDYW